MTDENDQEFERLMRDNIRADHGVEILFAVAMFALSLACSFVLVCNPTVPTSFAEVNQWFSDPSQHYSCSH